MTYLDTDVLINAWVEQDAGRTAEARNLIVDIYREDTVCVSYVTVQEVLFVLERKLGFRPDFIVERYKVFQSYRMLELIPETIERAVQLASEVGFRHINDCVHAAVAERYCDKLITYNKRDFKRIAAHCAIPIEILN